MLLMITRHNHIRDLWWYLLRYLAPYVPYSASHIIQVVPYVTHMYCGIDMPCSNAFLQLNARIPPYRSYSPISEHRQPHCLVHHGIYIICVRCEPRECIRLTPKVIHTYSVLIISYRRQAWNNYCVYIDESGYLLASIEPLCGALYIGPFFLVATLYCTVCYICCWYPF